MNTYTINPYTINPYTIKTAAPYDSRLYDYGSTLLGGPIGSLLTNSLLGGVRNDNDSPWIGAAKGFGGSLGGGLVGLLGGGLAGAGLGAVSLPALYTLAAKLHGDPTYREDLQEATGLGAGLGGSVGAALGGLVGTAEGNRWSIPSEEKSKDKDKDAK